MISDDTDYYDVLEVESSASPQEITRSYRRLAKKLHPDANNPTADAALFDLVTKAYEVLGDPDKRATYDRSRADTYEDSDEDAPAARPRPRPDHVDFQTMKPGESKGPVRVLICSEGGWPIGEVSPERTAGPFWKGAVKFSDSPEIDEMYHMEITAEIPWNMAPGPKSDSLCFRWGDEESTLLLNVIVAAQMKEEAPRVPGSDKSVSGRDKSTPGHDTGGAGRDTRSAERDRRRKALMAERDALRRRTLYLPDSNFTVAGFIFGSLAVFVGIFFGLLTILYAVDVYRPTNNDYGPLFLPMLVGTLALMSVVAIVRAIAVDRGRSLERRISACERTLKDLG